MENGMIGKYVIVRCRDAGVHAGILQGNSGRECILTDSRRLWYWHCVPPGKFLSGVAAYGLSHESKLGTPLALIHLTEACEIIQCTDVAERLIKAVPDDAQ
jgi:hypothetical protein